MTTHIQPEKNEVSLQGILNDTHQIRDTKDFSLLSRIFLLAAGIFGHAVTFLANGILFPLQVFRPIKVVRELLDYGFHVSQGFIRSANQSFQHGAPPIEKQILFVLCLQYSLSKENAGVWKSAHEIASVNRKKLILGSIPREGDTSLKEYNIKHIASFVEPFELENTCMGILSSDRIEEYKVQRRVYTTKDFSLPKKDSIFKFCEDFLNPENTGSTYGHCKAGRSRSALNFLAVLAIAGYFGKDNVQMNVAESEKRQLPPAPRTKDEFDAYLRVICDQMKSIRAQVHLSKRHLQHLSEILYSAHVDGELNMFSQYFH